MLYCSNKMDSQLRLGWTSIQPKHVARPHRKCVKGAAAVQRLALPQPKSHQRLRTTCVLVNTCKKAAACRIYRSLPSTYLNIRQSQLQWHLLLSTPGFTDPLQSPSSFQTHDCIAALHCLPSLQVRVLYDTYRQESLLLLRVQGRGSQAGSARQRRSIGWWHHGAGL